MIFQINYNIAERHKQGMFTVHKFMHHAIHSGHNTGHGVVSFDLHLQAAFSHSNHKPCMESVSHYITIALENARLYEELKALDKAKERVINHLSHELTTPVAIVAGVLGQVLRDLEKGHAERIEKTVQRGFRNVKRLQDLMNKIDDIIHMKSLPDKNRITGMIEDALGLVEEQRDRNPEMSREDLLERVSERLEELCSYEETRPERIALADFMNAVCDEVVAAMGGREVDIVRDLEKDLHLYMDRDVLRKVCLGLLKNAVENTPDQGKIEISSRSGDHSIEIDFRDYGVGISPENQKMIFGGFFHTQETHAYASRKPYAFNAGGAGADLLRTKVFSERYGFAVDFESERCGAIPRDRDMCPGAISACEFVKDKSECALSGGSTFSVRFPRVRFASNGDASPESQTEGASSA